MLAESSMSLGSWDTSPLSVRARWLDLGVRILQNKIRATYLRKAAHIFPWFDKPSDDGGVPLLQRRERDIRFQLAVVDEFKALVVEHGLELGSRNEAVAVPNTLAGIHGRGGDGLPLRWRNHPWSRPFTPLHADFQEDMKHKKPERIERYHQVSSLFGIHTFPLLYCYFLVDPTFLSLTCC